MLASDLDSPGLKLTQIDFLSPFALLPEDRRRFQLPKIFNIIFFYNVYNEHGPEEQFYTF
jgi:hypothetical protein